MTFSFYPQLEQSCPNVSHCPHLGGAVIGTVVLLANQTEESRAYLFRTIDAERKTISELLKENERLHKELDQVKLELKLERQNKFPQSSYVRWTTNQYTDCCLALSQRVYRLIPTAGTGTSGTNYDETDFGYDMLKRRNRTVTPGGTITDLVYDPRGLILATYLGTNDTGATVSNPAAGGPPNNMVLIATNEYDGGVAGGDGNLTKLIEQVDATTTRVTVMTYDFRNRPVTTDGEIDYFEVTYYDNLDRVVQAERYDTVGPGGSSSSSSSSSLSSGSTVGNLIARTVTIYDDRSRLYQTVVYAVDPKTGIVGNSLTDNSWYDASGNEIKSFPAGSQLFTKTTFDSLGRAVIQYAAYGPDTTYADASSVASNTVLEQGETMYDADSNAIQVVSRQRYHNAATTQLGALQDPNTTPKARVTYVAQYPDAIGRPASTANYGTNAGTALSRPATIPGRSDTVLVNSVSYDSTGNVLQTTDPAGMAARIEYDAAGRKTKVTENYVATSSSSSSSTTGGVGACAGSDDANRVTRFTYTPDGNEATQVAENARTGGDQTTTNTYGTTLTESAVATSTLLRYIDYPDSTGGSDRVASTYNRQGEKTTVTDQRGCVHSLVYDALARLTNDQVTTLGTGVDGAVRRLAAAYEVRGLTSKLTSYDNATVGSGAIVNDVGLTYNSFGQLIADAQSHSGAVVPGTTPQVQYAYANGSSNMIRPTTLTYPNARAITLGYGTAGGINDSASRVDGLIDGGTTLVNYAYLGLGTAVQTTYPQPSMQHTLLGSGSGPSPAGDIYWGLDLFGRIIDSRWFNTGTSTDVDRIKYGYDRASNRIWRRNPVATAASAKFDEFYRNDGLQRLKDMQRGTLNGSNTGITAPTFEQCWTLDPTGNWRGFNEAASGTAWTLNQTRTANAVNEITGITKTVGATWANPAYDLAGNMTTMPQPANPSATYTATYDAWNRLVTLASGGTMVQQNQYDARNFRTIRITTSPSETRHFYYTAGWRCIEERLGASTTPDVQSVWGARYIDDLVVRDRVADRLYALQDANWNVTSVIDIAGAVQERYSYTAYGTPTFLSSGFGALSTSSFAWEMLYCGYRFDVEKWNGDRPCIDGGFKVN